MKEYSVRIDGDKLLSPNFRVREFACHCGADRVLICSDLVILLQRTRDQFGAPVTINSAFRTEEHNRRVGGATNSQHLRGTAADITVRGITPLAVAQFAEHLGAGGIGLYAGFTHIDTRAGRVRWDQRSGREVVVPGFPGFVPTPPPQPPLPPPEEEEPDMTEPQVKALIEQMMTDRLTGNGTTPSAWAQSELEQAVAAGITDGTRPRGFATREEVALMAHRAAKAE